MFEHLEKRPDMISAPKCLIKEQKMILQNFNGLMKAFFTFESFFRHEDPQRSTKKTIRCSAYILIENIVLFLVGAF